MSIKIISIIFFYLILFCIVLEFLLRIFYSVFHKIYKQKGWIKSIIFPYKFNYFLYENFGKIKNKKFNLLKILLKLMTHLLNLLKIYIVVIMHLKN